MAEQYPQVNCPLFLEIEWDIRELVEDINQTQDLFEKKEQTEKLEKLMDMAQGLLSCSRYKEGCYDCAKCREVADLHNRTAHLLIRAQEIYRFIHAQYFYC